MQTKDLRKGNLILFDHDVRRNPAKPMLRGVVDKVEGEKILFENGYVTHKDRCDFIKLDDAFMKHYGFIGHDLGDYFQYEKEGFVIIKPKLQVVPGVEMDYMVAMPKQDPPLALKYVHELQNLICSQK